MSFTRLAGLVGRAPSRPSRTAPADKVLSDYVGYILMRLPPPWHYTCLRRGIVMYHLLRRAGRDVGLRIGVRKQQGELLAHAWLVKDGAAYLEPNKAEHEAFQVIATFPATAPAR